MALSFEHVKHVENVAMLDGLAYIRHRFPHVKEDSVIPLLLEFIHDFANGFPYGIETSLAILEEYKRRNIESENISNHLALAKEAIVTAVYDKIKKLNMHVGWGLLDVSIMLLTLSQKNHATSHLFSVEKMLYENKEQFKALNRARTRGVF